MQEYPNNIFGGANGVIEVYVSRAKDLPNLRKMDKQSPFVRLRIGHMTEASEVAYRGGQTPKFQFYTKFDLTPDVKPTLSVELFDDRSPPKLIGQCEVDLTPALYKDPEDGHDDWFPLFFGSEEAGKVYMELTFHPVVLTSQARLPEAEEESNFEASLSERCPPPLPSKLPNFETNSPVKTSTGYMHASRLRQETPNFHEERIFPQTAGPRVDFTSSISTNATNESQTTHNSQESHSTVNSTGTTEPLFAKLKQLKEKWKSIKNPSSDILDQGNRLDLEALQKVVGVDPEDRDADHNRPERFERTSTIPNGTPPSMPRIPKNVSGKLSMHSRPATPKLPPLPTDSPLRSRNSSPSPPRRRPPPST
ncbi:LAMI_0B01266g1_1 [Lachancea mirantina]|uniref:LAMI_0B01266g1_1 n=1 Tax=Lachancea mirantina TaxID=1230905 RepID=A0A1G4ITL0_9SACH|nr:LAMI_0B01266g1_1 [Lachancea mirantina]